MNNNNNNTSIYSDLSVILITATIVMAILKYKAGYDIPTTVVFVPLIAMAILFGIRLIITIIAVVVITLVDLHQENKRWHSFNHPFERSHRIYWNPETKEMKGVEPMPEYDKRKDEE